MKRKGIEALILLGMLTVLFNFACGSRSQNAVPETCIPVKTGKVTIEEMAIPIRTSGRLYPKTQVKLSFKTGGLIEEIFVEEGDTVRRHQLLARLDLSEVNGRFTQAENAFSKAARDKKRVENLYRDQAATLEQLQNIDTAFKIAQADLEVARFNLEHSKIVAPSEGKILRRLAETGEMIGVGRPVFLFGSTANEWVVKVGVAEVDIVRLALNDAAGVTFDAYPRQVFPARVSEITEAMDPASGTYEVELSIDSEGMRLVSGFVARVEIHPSEKRTFSVVPVDALVEGEGSDGFVYIVTDRIARKIKVRIARLFDNRVAVRSGLEGITEVVTRGAPYLDDGSRVNVID